MAFSVSDYLSVSFDFQYIIMNIHIYKIIMYNYYNNSIKYFGDLYKCKKLF